MNFLFYYRFFFVFFFSFFLLRSKSLQFHSLLFLKLSCVSWCWHISNIYGLVRCIIPLVSSPAAKASHSAYLVHGISWYKITLMFLFYVCCSIWTFISFDGPLRLSLFLSPVFSHFFFSFVHFFLAYPQVFMPFQCLSLYAPIPPSFFPSHFQRKIK